MVMVYWKQDYTGVEKEKNIMAKYVMALDAGTTSNRCILFVQRGAERIHTVFSKAGLGRA